MKMLSYIHEGTANTSAHTNTHSSVAVLVVLCAEATSYVFTGCLTVTLTTAVAAAAVWKVNS